jgi:hypothetical protein
MLSTRWFIVLAVLATAILAAPGPEAVKPEVVRAVDLEDGTRERRSCVAGAGGNVCLNGPYRKLPSCTGCF